MARKRDYKAEYRRRIERGLSKGLSRSQARGHPAITETSASGVQAPNLDDQLEAALKAMRRGATQKAAAQSAGVSAERLRRFICGRQLAVRSGATWVLTDDCPRRVAIISRGQTRSVTVASFADAQKAGEYFHAAGEFLRSNDPIWLERFEGDGLTDIRGTFFPFETDPNALYRHAAADAPAFHEIYQIVST